eukprot:10316458-Lingulodinium_polyedra.AAC.1
MEELRRWLAKGYTSTRWTAAENMPSDPLTKPSTAGREYLRRLLAGGVWSVQRDPEILNPAAQRGRALNQTQPRKSV